MVFFSFWRSAVIPFPLLAFSGGPRVPRGQEEEPAAGKRGPHQGAPVFLQQSAQQHHKHRQGLSQQPGGRLQRRRRQGINLIKLIFVFPDHEAK